MSRFPRVRVWVLAGVWGDWVLTEVAAPGGHRGSGVRVLTGVALC